MGHPGEGLDVLEVGHRGITRWHVLDRRFHRLLGLGQRVPLLGASRLHQVLGVLLGLGHQVVRDLLCLAEQSDRVRGDVSPLIRVRRTGAQALDFGTQFGPVRIGVLYLVGQLAQVRHYFALVQALPASAEGLVPDGVRRLGRSPGERVLARHC